MAHPQKTVLAICRNFTALSVRVRVWAALGKMRIFIWVEMYGKVTMRKCWRGLCNYDNLIRILMGTERPKMDVRREWVLGE